jgi:hypothetical protein
MNWDSSKTNIIGIIVDNDSKFHCQSTQRSFTNMSMSLIFTIGRIDTKLSNSSHLWSYQIYTSLVPSLIMNLFLKCLKARMKLELEWFWSWTSSLFFTYFLCSIWSCPQMLGHILPE